MWVLTHGHIHVLVTEFKRLLLKNLSDLRVLPFREHFQFLHADEYPFQPQSLLTFCWKKVPNAQAKKVTFSFPCFTPLHELSKMHQISNFFPKDSKFGLKG